MLQTKMKVKKMRRSVRRKKQLRKIANYAMVAISAIALTLIFTNSGKNDERMQYATVVDRGMAVTTDHSKVFEIPASYSKGDTVIIICDGDKITVKSQTYFVRSGDTLWSIAQEYCDDSIDIRDYIYEIKKLNGISENLSANTSIEMPIL